MYIYIYISCGARRAGGPAREAVRALARPCEGCPHAVALGRRRRGSPELKLSPGSRQHQG